MPAEVETRCRAAKRNCSPGCSWEHRGRYRLHRHIGGDIGKMNDKRKQKQEPKQKHNPKRK